MEKKLSCHSLNDRLRHELQKIQMRNGYLLNSNFMGEKLISQRVRVSFHLQTNVLKYMVDCLKWESDTIPVEGLQNLETQVLQNCGVLVSVVSGKTTNFLYLKHTHQALGQQKTTNESLHSPPYLIIHGQAKRESQNAKINLQWQLLATTTRHLELVARNTISFTKLRQLALTFKLEPKNSIQIRTLLLNLKPVEIVSSRDVFKLVASNLVTPDLRELNSLVSYKELLDYN